MPTTRARPQPARWSAARNLRVRVGDHRIIYAVQDEVLLVVVITNGHRREIYARWTGFPPNPALPADRQLVQA